MYWKVMKYVQIYLLKFAEDLYTENNKTFLGDIIEDLDNQKDIACSWVIRLKTLKYQFSSNRSINLVNLNLMHAFELDYLTQGNSCRISPCGSHALIFCTFFFFLLSNIPLRVCFLSIHPSLSLWSIFLLLDMGLFQSLKRIVNKVAMYMNKRSCDYMLLFILGKIVGMELLPHIVCIYLSS